MNRYAIPALAAVLMSSAAAIAAEPAAQSDAPATPAAPPSTERTLEPAPAEKMAPETKITPPITAPAPQAAAPSVSSNDGATLMLSDDQAKKWIDKVIYSSDDKNLGEVAAFARDASGHVTEMHADIGGFLGVGEKRVRVNPDDFMLSGDRVVLKLTADQAKALPQVPNT